MGFMGTLFKLWVFYGFYGCGGFPVKWVVLCYLREDIPWKLLGVEMSPAECFYREINLRKKVALLLL